MRGRTCRNPACELYAGCALAMCWRCRNAWAMGRKEAETEALPTQPKDGAVVIDQDGDAWQRDGRTWYRAKWKPNGSGSSGIGLNWANLVRASTSLREMH